MVLRATQQHVSVLSEGDGKLRATQQHVSVLSEGVGKLRVTRQYIEILSALTDTKMPLNTIGISQDLSVEKKQSVIVVSTVSLSQDTVISPVSVDVTNTLDLTSTAYNPGDIEKGFYQSIGTSQIVSYSVIPDIQAITQDIGISDIADTQIKGRSAVSTIGITHEATAYRPAEHYVDVVSDIDIWGWAYRGGTTNVSVATSLTHSRLETVQLYDSNGNPTSLVTVVVEDGLRQSVDISGTYNDFNDGNHIGVTDTVSYLKIPFIGIDKSATSTLSLSHSTSDSLGVDSNLLLSQSVISVDATGADNSNLALTQEAGFSVDGLRLPESTIGLSYGVSYYIVSDSFCDYEINVGSTTETGLPALPVEPTIVKTDRISLAYPAVAPTTTLYFNAPEWGNLHEIYQRRIDRRSRGGTRIIYRDSDWRKHEIFKITLTNVTEAESDNLLSFFSNSIGEPILYTDYESQEWTVIVLNPEEQIVRDRFNNTVAIEMETV